MLPLFEIITVCAVLVVLTSCVLNISGVCTTEISARPDVQLSEATVSAVLSVSLVNTTIAVSVPIAALSGGLQMIGSVAVLVVSDMLSVHGVVVPTQPVVLNLNQPAVLFMNVACVTPSGPLVPLPLLLTVMFWIGLVPTRTGVGNVTSVTAMTPVAPVPVSVMFLVCCAGSSLEICSVVPLAPATAGSNVTVNV